jgi:hypothetical protein
MAVGKCAGVATIRPAAHAWQHSAISRGLFFTLLCAACHRRCLSRAASCSRERPRSVVKTPAWCVAPLALRTLAS